MSPPSYLPTAPMSPKLRLKRSTSLFALQSKTNIELMATDQLSGKFKTVGHCALGVAVINRLNGLHLKAEDVENEKVNDGGYHETGRRSQMEMNAGHN